MRIVIAPDKFKGSLSAPEVAHAVAAGLRAGSKPGAIVRIDHSPAADGGEGTLDAAVAAGFSLQFTTVTGPTGEPVEAPIAIRSQQAVIEMALASGLAVLPVGVLNARGASSRGTGELIRFALDHGCTEIVLGVGGSASTDGGAGVLAGLGVKLLTVDGVELPPGGAALAALDRIDLSGLDPRLPAASITLASDVDNPLLGPSGAAVVFGPQKGASPEDVRDLDAALERFVGVLTATMGAAVAEAAHAPGAGAAGGVGFAALAVLGAQRRPGVDVVLELTGLLDKIRDADLVITGEGSLDEQSLGGKTPLGVASAAAAERVRVIAVCGRTALTPEQLQAAGFEKTFALTDLEANTELCMANAAALLEQVGRNIAAHLQVTAGRE